MQAAVGTGRSFNGTVQKVHPTELFDEQVPDVYVIDAYTQFTKDEVRSGVYHRNGCMYTPSELKALPVHLDGSESPCAISFVPTEQAVACLAAKSHPVQVALIRIWADQGGALLVGGGFCTHVNWCLWPYVGALSHTCSTCPYIYAPCWYVNTACQYTAQLRGSPLSYRMPLHTFR